MSNLSHPILIVTGMHRSGTSLTASLLQSAGVDMGNNLMPPSEGNVKGYFEDLDIVQFHEKALKANHLPPEGWTMVNQVNYIPEELKLIAKEVIFKKRNQANITGWKDPRTTLFLEFWKTLLPEAKFLLIYRSPWEVIDSLYRRGDGAFLNNPNLAINLWCSYNETILNFYNKHSDSCILSEIDYIIQNDQDFLELIKNKLSIPLQKAGLSKLYDSSLFHKSQFNTHRFTIIQKYFEEAIDIYNRLHQNSLDIRSNTQINYDYDFPSYPLPKYKSWVLQDWLDIRRKESELKQTQTALEQSQNELKQTQTALEESQNELKQTQTALEESQNELYHYQVQLKEAQMTIVAMETSKFWKLRKIWFKCKDLLKLKLYFNYINKLKIAIFLLFNNGIKYTLKVLSEADNIPNTDDINYKKWLAIHHPNSVDLIGMTEDIRKLEYKPIISIIMPVFNTHEQFLKEAIESVLKQIYSYWELCIADDCSTEPYVRKLLNQYQAKDNRIKVIFREENGHISKSSNSALSLATGEYIALLDHDDLLTPNALYEIVKLLNQKPEADMIYSDEDKINEEGKLQDPYFKPDWCPDSFLSRMYTNHLGVYRHKLIHEIGGFREGYEGSQDYDLALRITDKTSQIFHIPKVLYHWRIHSDSTAQSISTKDYSTEVAKKALESTLKRRGEKGMVVPVRGGHHIIRYEIKDYNLVSIIIPTKNLGATLNTCLKSIFDKTIYPNYEVLVIDNGSTEQETKIILESWKTREPEKFRYETLDIPFNFSKINNYGVEQAKGKYLLFLNNDTEVINRDWLNAMVEQAQRPSIGAVGALLLYKDNTIQHAGVVAGIGDVAGHSHKYYSAESHGYFNQIQTNNNYSAVTGACLMCRREVFKEVGGFEEELAVAFNDIDLCFKMLNQGYKNIYLPHVKLYHYESKSRGYDDDPEKQVRFTKEIKHMKSKWKQLIESDPCYSPHLTKQSEDFTIEI